MQQQTEAPLIFLSYADEDRNLCKQLEQHLSALKRQGLIDTWEKQQIIPGDDRSYGISAALERASLILLLISPAFMDSDYCYSIEMKRALELHEQKKARVIPILLRPVNWHGAPFAHLEPLPTSRTNREFVTLWKNQDNAFLAVEEGIRRAIVAMAKKKPDDKTGLGKIIFPDLSRRHLIYLGAGFGLGFLTGWMLLEGPGIVNTIDCDSTTLVYRNHTSVVETVVWSPDGSQMASGSWDMTVQVWDAANGNNIHIYKRHTDEVRSVAWSPLRLPQGFFLLASGSYDTKVMI